VLCRLSSSFLWLKALLIALLGYGFIGLVLHKTNFDITYDYGIVRCLAGFYTGVFCYQLKQRVKMAPLSQRSIALSELLACATFFLVLRYAEWHVVVLYGSLPLLAIIILLLSSRRSGPVGKLLESRLLTWVGSLAFSIYLTHYMIVLTAANFFQYVLHWPMQQVREQYGIPVMGFVGAWAVPVNIALIWIVLGVSYLTYSWIESPCRRWSRTLAARWESGAPLLGAS
jgi:peptidoglycan/LPS O-acetylase OafA/YrhL